MQEHEIIRALNALGQSTRLRVLRTLAGSDGCEKTAGNISDMLGAPASTLSFHLKELAHAGLIQQRRNGRNLKFIRK